MKHNLKITFILIGMFLITQLIGLMVITSYDTYFGKTAQEHGAIRPDISLIYESVPPAIEIKTALDITQILASIIFAIAIATLAFFLLSRLKITLIFRIWFTFVVFICLTMAFALIFYPAVGNVFLSVFGKTFSLAELLALPLAALFTFYKIFKRNLVAHNFSELFIYPGLAIVFIPILNVIVATLLLIAISIYDMWAVWKSKHMIKLAKFQIDKLKIFTGFFVPYLSKKDRVKVQRAQAMAKRIKTGKKKGKGRGRKLKEIKVRAQIAALGGGDVAFPLIFAGTIMLAFNVLAALIVVFCATLSLLTLLYYSEKGKFYPAMPFLTIGCFIGLALVLLFF